MSGVKAIFNYSKYKEYLEADGFVRIFSRFNYPLFLLALFFTIFLVVAVIYYYLIFNSIDLEYLYFLFVMLTICYVLRFKTDYTKNDRIILFLIFYYSFRFIVSLAFMGGALLVYFDQRSYWIYPFILGACWLPSVEFIKEIRPALKYIAILRVLVTIFILYRWISL